MEWKHEMIECVHEWVDSETVDRETQTQQQFTSSGANGEHRVCVLIGGQQAEELEGIQEKRGRGSAVQLSILCC